MVRIGDVLVGFWFNRDYQKLRVEVVGADYLVVRDERGLPDIVTDRSPDDLWEYCLRNSDSPRVVEWISNNDQATV